MAMKPVIEGEPVVKERKKRKASTSKNPTFLDKEYKAKRPRGRPRKNAA